MTNKVEIQNAISFETVIFCRKFHIVLYHRIITLRIIMHFWEIMGNLYTCIFVVGKNVQMYKVKYSLRHLWCEANLH